MGQDLPLMFKTSPPPAYKWLAVAGFTMVLAACSPTVDHRGYVAKPGAFDQISSGMSKTEVEGILGSPSTTASVKFKGDSYYYITSITESRAFLTPAETNREIIAIRFNETDQVQSFAQYGLQDGRIIDVNTRKTLVVGEDEGLLKQLFRGIQSTTSGPMLGRRL
jgi:outer membrane protein assembly factor BamE (lipoprotein component of BamABCDE complex)